MTTAIEIIERSLNELGVSSHVNPADPLDVLACFNKLKQLIVIWEQQNIALGITIPTTTADDLGEPDWATLGIETNLALMYAPQAKVMAGADLVRLAREQKTFIQTRAAPTPTQSYPASLPLGQGNKQWPGRPRFFPDPDLIEGENAAVIISEGS